MTSAFTSEERIERRRQDLWRFMTDPRHAHEWVRGLADVQPSARRVRVGSRYREGADGAGDQAPQELVITAYEPPNLYRAALETTGGRLVYEYRLFAAGPNATRVAFEVRAEPASLRGRLYLARGVRSLRAHDGDQLGRLKRAVERHVRPAGWKPPLAVLKDLVGSRSRRSRRSA